LNASKICFSSSPLTSSTVLLSSAIFGTSWYPSKCTASCDTASSRFAEDAWEEREEVWESWSTAVTSMCRRLSAVIVRCRWRFA
jgi:hypothetical protein